MKRAELIAVKTTTMARPRAQVIGPLEIETETDFKQIIQGKFDEYLKGVAGYFLVEFNGKIYQCERDPVDPSKPYVRHPIKYHPEQNRFSSRWPWVLPSVDNQKISDTLLKYFTNQKMTQRSLC